MKTIFMGLETPPYTKASPKHSFYFQTRSKKPRNFEVYRTLYNHGKQPSKRTLGISLEIKIGQKKPLKQHLFEKNHFESKQKPKKRSRCIISSNFSKNKIHFDPTIGA
jgi:hypothetical protein